MGAWKLSMILTAGIERTQSVREGRSERITRVFSFDPEIMVGNGSSPD
jgi:hypothetical protein